MGTKARSGCGADVAVINGALHAFEIKSDSDSLERLPGQIEAYRAFSWKPNKVYAESFKDEAHLRAIVEEAQLIVTNALA